EDQLTEGAISIIDLFLACGLGASKSEARRLIQQGGVFLEGEKVADLNLTISKDQLSQGVKLRKGKKVHHKAILG
ncbi:MAG: tyrosine--tRNA ligase, partial [Clostridia bacterium]|nr:tyrosine--tRNA ligase [Clostridia bacterium]